MAIEHWLIIATIISAIVMAIATLFAPALAVLAQYRISQPKPKPETNQPKNRTQRIGGWLMRVLRSPRQFWISSAVCLLVILVDIYLLLRELRETTPVTRGSVFLIALTVAGIIYGSLSITLIVAHRAINQIYGHISEIQDVQVKLLEIDKGTLDITQTLAKAIAVTNETSPPPRQLQPALDKTPQGLIEKLQAKIGRLFGD